MVGTNTFGKLGRLGLAVLKHFQYHNVKQLTDMQIKALLFHRLVIRSIPPKLVSATRQPGPPDLLYSDAE